MARLACDRMLASHARPCLLPERSELGHDAHDIVENLADKMLNVSGLSFFLLLKGQCHPAELPRILLQYTELFGEHCASGHSGGQLPSHKPEKRGLLKWTNLELFLSPIVLRGVRQPRLLLLPLIPT